MQADTIVPDPGNPQSLNRYSYVYNNPMLYNDPTGHYAPGICHNNNCWPDPEDEYPATDLEPYSHLPTGGPAAPSLAACAPGLKCTRVRDTRYFSLPPPPPEGGDVFLVFFATCGAISFTGVGAVACDVADRSSPSLSVQPLVVPGSILRELRHLAFMPGEVVLSGQQRALTEPSRHRGQPTLVTSR
jgi:hypothetical protein